MRKIVEAASVDKYGTHIKQPLKSKMYKKMKSFTCSDKVKGDGYWSGSDGLHTVSYTASRYFHGTITMQATLASEPLENDWFNIYDTTSTYTPINTRNTSTVDIYNFTGNFVWVRGKIMIDEGTVSVIQYNH